MLRQLMVDSRYSALRTNLLLNPSCETAAVNVLTRVNLATIPAATAYASGTNTTLGWANSRWFGGGAAAGTYSLVTGAADGPIPGITTYARKTWTVVTGANVGDVGFQSNSWTGYVAGQVYTASAWMRSSAARTTNGFDFWAYDATGQIWRTNMATQPIAAGVWTRFSGVFTAPANATSVTITLDSDAGIPIVGDYIDVTGLLVEAGGSVGSVSRTNLHPNPAVGRNATGWNPAAGGGTFTVTRETTMGTTTGSLPMGASQTWYKSTNTVTNTTSPWGIYTQAGGTNATPVTAGQSYVFAAYHVSNMNSSATVRMIWYWLDAAGATVSTGNSTLMSNTPDAWQRLTSTAQVAPANAAFVQLAVVQSGTGIPVGTYMGVTCVEIQQATTLTSYFDGAMVGTAAIEYGWNGTPFNSSSVVRNPPSGQVNPYFDGTLKMATRTNLLPNPSVEVGAGGWSIGSAGTGGTAVPTRELAGGVNNGAFYRMTQTVANTAGSPYVSVGNGISSYASITPGQQYMMSAWVRCSKAISLRIQMVTHTLDGGGWNGGGTGVMTALVPNVWTRLSVLCTPTANQAWARCIVETVGQIFDVGTTYDVDAVLIEPGNTLGAYFDGATRPPTRINAAANPTLEVNAGGYQQSGSATFGRTTAEAHSGSASLFVTTTGLTNQGFSYAVANVLPVTSLTPVTISMWIKAPVGLALRLTPNEYIPPSTSVGSSGSVDFTGTGSWQRVSATRTPTTVGNVIRPSLVTTGAHTATTFYVDDLLIESSATMQSYFDGSTTAGLGYTYAWTGTAHSSASNLYTANESVAWAGAAHTSPSYVYDNDFSSYAWTGTANASTSAVYGPGVANNVTSNAFAIQSTRWAASGTKSIRQITRAVGGDAYTVVAATVAGGGGSSGLATLELGKTYTVTATLHQEGPLLGSGNSNGARQIVVIGSAPWTATRSVQGANAAGNYVHTVTFTVPSTVYGQVRLYHGHPMTTGQLDVWWDNIVLEEAGGQRVYFDGTYPNAKWNGTAHQSTSTGLGFVGM